MANKHHISSDYISNVITHDGRFSLENKNCCNTVALLEKYTMFTTINKIEQSFIRADNNYNTKLISIVKIFDDIILPCNDESYASYASRIIAATIKKAINYIEINDKYGKLVKDMIETRYMIDEEHTQFSDRENFAKRYLAKDTIHPLTYIKYLKYSIKKMDEYLFSDANEYKLFLVDYIKNHSDSLYGFAPEKEPIIRYFLEHDIKSIYDEYSLYSEIINHSLTKENAYRYICLSEIHKELEELFQLCDGTDCENKIGSLLKRQYIDQTKTDITNYVGTNRATPTVSITTVNRAKKRTIHKIAFMIWNDDYNFKLVREHLALKYNDKGEKPYDNNN